MCSRYRLLRQSSSRKFTWSLSETTLTGNLPIHFGTPGMLVIHGSKAGFAGKPRARPWPPSRCMMDDRANHRTEIAAVSVLSQPVGKPILFCFAEQPARRPSGANASAADVLRHLGRMPSVIEPGPHSSAPKLGHGKLHNTDAIPHHYGLIHPPVASIRARARPNGHRTPSNIVHP